MRWRQQRRRRAALTAAAAEDRCVAAFGRDRIQVTSTDGGTTIRRTASGTEPLLFVVVNGLGKVAVLLGDFENDDDWQAAIDTLGSPQLADVHQTPEGVHCFVLDGPGGAVLFMLSAKRIGGAGTEQWLRSLAG